VVEDDRGEKLELESEPERVVSIGPSITEILFAIEVQDRIAGIDNRSNYPPETAELPRIGDMMGLDYEKIAELEPDLILCIDMAEGVEKLSTLGVPVYVKDPKNLEEVVEAIAVFGKVFNVVDRADEVAAELEQGIENVRSTAAEIPEEEMVTVFYEVWPKDPLMTAGPGSFIHDAIVTAGGKNIAATAEQPWASFSAEAVVEANPDVIVTTFKETHEELTSGKREAWNSIAAVQNERVCLVDEDLVSRPAPRFLKGLQAIAKCLYPEKFE
jgi:iron complex transport system substrate-binding protein